MTANKRKINRPAPRPRIEAKLAQRLPFDPLLDLPLPNISPAVPAIMLTEPPSPEMVRICKAFNVLIDDAKREWEPKQRQIDQKFSLLFKAYQINESREDRWKLLARCLAATYIPGFMVGELPGAKQQWGPGELSQLFTLVERKVDIPLLYN